METQTNRSQTHAPSHNFGNIKDWIEGFYLAKRAERVTRNTLRIYQSHLNKFLSFCKNNSIEDISEISSNIIRKYLLWMGEAHNSGGVHQSYRIIKTFLRWFENEYEPINWTNPIQKINPPKLNDIPLEPIEIDIVRMMIDKCNNSFLGKRDKAAILFLFDSGVRASEFLALEIKDVNLITGTITIKRGKGGKARTVFIGKSCRKALRKYLQGRHDNKPVLWITRHNKPLNYGGLRALLNRYSMPNISISAHSFRRGFALNMLRSGVDIYTLSALMGHSDIKVLGRYLKLIDDDLRNAHIIGSPGDKV